MPNPLFAIPLNMGTGTWIVTIVAGLSFVVMFGIASAFGDFQGLINNRHGSSEGSSFSYG